MILGADMSHYQSGTDFAQVKAGGLDFVVIKASEGIGYTDPSFTIFREQAHTAGLLVGIYHFGQDNDPAEEAGYFASVVGPLRPGEFLALDQEVPHTAGNVPWCLTWLDATRTHYGIAPLLYANQGSGTGIASGDWTPAAAAHGLWLARYDNAPTVIDTVPYWGTPAMKQYSDAGTVPGVPGPCDIDVFHGTHDQLLAYGTTGDNDMTPDQDARLRNVENILAGLQNDVNDPRIGLLRGVSDLHGKVVDSRFDLTGRPGPDADDLLGQVLSTRAELRALGGKVAAPVPVTMDAAGFLTALKDDPAAMEALGKIIAPSVAAAVIAQIGAHLTTPPAA